jgi:hypothetical protein
MFSSVEIHPIVLKFLFFLEKSSVHKTGKIADGNENPLFFILKIKIVILRDWFE